MRRFISSGALLLLVLTVMVNPSAAQEGATPVPKVQAPQVFNKSKSPSRLDSLLTRLGTDRTRPSAQRAAEAPTFSGDHIAVSIRTAGPTDAIEALLASGRGRVANRGDSVIEAFVAVDALADLAVAPGVLSVRALRRPIAEGLPGATRSQAAPIQGASSWNAAGFTGAGVKVGVIDVGFIGYGAKIGEDVPAPAGLRCYSNVATFNASLATCETDTNHGTGVTESLIDMAPGASVFLANPFSESDLAATVAWMVSQGVQVINHSVSWIWDGPGDGTSPFSNSVKSSIANAVAGGVVWVNAAGNKGTSSWTGPSADADSDNVLEFSSGVELNRFTASPGSSVTVQARWTDSWTAATSDIDLCLLNSALVAIGCSEDFQNGQPGQVPLEVVGALAPANGIIYVVLSRFGGPYPPSLQVQEASGRTLTVRVPANSLSNPADSSSTGMLSVGAANWQNPCAVESFSSRGPTADGRIKPDVVGLDAADTITYGPNGFFGTSQAAPHVAGLAALVRQRYPTLTPVDVKGVLTANAIQESTPNPNNDWGAGLATLPAIPLATTGAYVALPSPARLLDTRSCQRTVDGIARGSGPLTGGNIIDVVVAGRAGVPVNAQAVVINLTATGSAGNGHLRVYPCGASLPVASSINYIVGTTIANQVVSKVGDAGKICIFALTSTDIVVDIVGYYPTDSAYSPLNIPARLLDTRPQGVTVDSQFSGTGPVQSGTFLALTVAGRGTIPLNSSTVFLNVTSTGAAGNGHLRVFPCGIPVPTASSLNYVAGQNTANGVFAKVGVGGQVCIYAATTTDVVVDAVGFHPDVASYVPLSSPVRLADTRPGEPTVDGLFSGAGTVLSGQTYAVTIGGRAGVPTLAKAVALNVAVTGAIGNGHLRVFPCGTPVPLSSSINYQAGRNLSNGAFAKLGSGGQVCIYALTTTHVVVDVVGYEP